jgi:dTDP-4-dehydrorhamnose 3,5-epimerase
MNFTPTSIPDVILIEPDVYRDPRGFFLETYHGRRYAEAGLPAFVQDNHSRSAQATLRGLHAQLKNAQGKLIRVVHGEIFDVAVDARPKSPTFGKWAGEVLSQDNFRQLYIPPGFLHGFCVLSPFAEVEYKCSKFYDATDEIGIAWNDPTLAIEWPIQRPMLSAKDGKLPFFEDVKSRFESYRF